MGKKLFTACVLCSWRDWPKPIFKNLSGGYSAAGLVHAMGALEKWPHLDIYLDRLAKVRLVRVLDDGKDGRIRADPVAIANLISDLRWEDNRTSLDKLHQYPTEGRQWERTCGSFCGLLCLIPPNQEGLQVSGRIYHELSDEEVKPFYSLVKADDFAQRLCRLGETFEASIWSNTDPRSSDGRVRIPRRSLNLLLKIPCPLWTYSK